MPAVKFTYDIDDKASNKLDTISSKLKNLKREAGEARKALSIANKGGAVIGAVSGALGGIFGGEDGENKVPAPVSAGQNTLLDTVSGLGSIASGALAGRVVGNLLPPTTWGGTGILATSAMTLARGGLMAAAAYGIGRTVSGLVEAARPIFSSAEVENVSKISTGDLGNREETTQRLLDSYLHKSYKDSFLFGDQYENRRQEIDIQLQIEGKKRTKELMESMWMQYRE